MKVVDKIGASVVRTVVPIIVGVVVGGGLKVGLHLDSTLLTEVLTTVVGGGYYAVVRYLETRYSVQWGWLLGKIGAPQYAVGSPQPVNAPVDGPKDDSVHWV